MKKLFTSIILLLSLGTVCLAAEMKVEVPADCKQCGMNRTTFSHSRMLLTYADGSSSGLCSINCVVKEVQGNHGKSVKSFLVGDYNSKKLIDARNATWVMGGKKKGVMTSVAKWAFTDKKEADAFIKENGGKLATFDAAMKAAEKEVTEKEPHGQKGHGNHKM